MFSPYLCLEANCNRKYKTKNGLESHLHKIHNIMIFDNFIPAFEEQKVEQKVEQLTINSFYLCSENNCNKKYKTENKLIDHLLQAHKIISNDDHQPVEITKENKKNVQNMKNNIKQAEQRELLIKEIAVKNQLELIAKLDAEDLYKQQLQEKYKLIEEQKLKLQDEKLQLEQINFEKLKLLEEEKVKQEEKLLADAINNSIELVPLINSIKEEYLSNPNLKDDLINVLSIYKDGSKHDFVEQAEKKAICSICFDNDADTAVVPCGHSSFCNECISEHHIHSQNKVCPICRTEIMMVVKLYS